MGEKSCQDLPILPHDHFRFGKGRDVGTSLEALPSGSTGSGHGAFRHSGNRGL